MADINITVIDDGHVNVQVVEEIVNVNVTDVPLPLDLYQKRITVSDTPPAHPEVGDLWLDTSV